MLFAYGTNVRHPSNSIGFTLVQQLHEITQYIQENLRALSLETEGTLIEDLNINNICLEIS